MAATKEQMQQELVDIKRKRVELLEQQYQQKVNEEKAVNREQQVTQQGDQARRMAQGLDPFAALANEQDLATSETEDERLKRVAKEQGIFLSGDDKEQAVVGKARAATAWGSYGVFGNPSDAIKPALDKFFTETLDKPTDVEVRMGKDTNRLEYKSPLTKEWTLVNKPGLSDGDMSQWLGEALVMGGETLGAIIGGAFLGSQTGGVGTAVGVAGGTAIGTFTTEVLRQLGGVATDLNDATFGEIVKDASLKAGFNATAGGVFDTLMTFGKAILNRFQGKMLKADEGDLGLDDEVNEGIINSINSKIEGDAAFNPRAGQRGSEELRAWDDMYAKNPTFGFTKAYSRIDAQNNDALLQYEANINKDFKNSNLPQYERGQQVQQGVLKEGILPKQSQLEEPITKINADLEEFYGELPSYNLEQVGLNLRPLARAKLEAVYETFGSKFNSFKREDITSSGETLTDLFNKINSDSKTSLIRGVATSRKSLIQGFDNITTNKNIIRELEGSDGLITFMDTVKGGGSVNLKQIQEALEDVNIVLKSKDSGIPDKDMNLLGNIKKALKAERDIMLEDYPVLRESIKDTEKGYSLAMDDVNQTIVGQLLAKDDAGRYVIRDEDTFESIIRPDKIVDARRTAELVKGSPAATNAMKQQILAFYKRKVYTKTNSNGKKIPDVNAHESFMAQYGDNISFFLTEREAQDMARVGGLAKTLETSLAIRDNALKAINKSTEMKLTNLEPDTIAKYLIGNGSIEKSLAIRSALKDTPETWNLVQSQVADYVSSSIRKDGTFDLGRMTTLLDKSGEAIGEVLGKDYVDGLKTLKNGFEMISRRSTLSPEKADVDNGLLMRLYRAFYFPPLTARGRAYTAVQSGKNDSLVKALGEVLKSPEDLKLLVKNRNINLSTRLGADVAVLLGLNGLLRSGENAPE